MTILRLLALLLGLSHLRGCFTPLCDAVRGFAPVESVSTRTGEQVMVNAVRGEESLVVATAIGFTPPEYHHTLVEVNDASGPHEIAKFELSNEFGAGVGGEKGKWWYSVAGEKKGDGEKAGVYFVSPEVTFVPVPGASMSAWIPFDGPEPRGLLIANRRDVREAIEITAGGIRRRWPLPQTNAWSFDWWTAERLVDGSIAVFSLESAGGAASRLVLRHLGADTEEVVLRDQLSHVRVVSAAATDGAVGVVIESKLGELEAAVFDPRLPAEVKWHQLATKEDRGRFPAAAFHDGKLIVAWFAEQTDQLRARTVTSPGPGLPAIIAPLLRRGGRLPAISILPQGEEILFVWQEDEIMTRRVPAEFAGLNLLEGLCSY